MSAFRTDRRLQRSAGPQAAPALLFTEDGAITRLGVWRALCHSLIWLCSGFGWNALVFNTIYRLGGDGDGPLRPSNPASPPLVSAPLGRLLSSGAGCGEGYASQVVIIPHPLKSVHTFPCTPIHTFLIWQVVIIACELPGVRAATDSAIAPEQPFP